MILFLSHHVPGVQLWFYPHLCMWSAHRSLVLRLPWSSWVCPCEDRVQRWYDCLDHGSPSSAKCTGKPVAMDARDMALVRDFSCAQHKAHEGQPWLGFFWHLAAGVRGPALRWLFFFKLPCSQHMRASSERASFIIVGRRRHVGERGYNSGFFPCV